MSFDPYEFDRDYGQSQPDGRASGNIRPRHFYGWCWGF